MPLSLPVLTLLTVLSGCSAGPSQTPLHTAAAEGDLVMIKQLLADGAGVDAVDESGLSPIHLAASRGRPQTIMMLVEHGASVNAKTSFGATPLHLAAHQSQVCLLSQ